MEFIGCGLEPHLGQLSIATYKKLLAVNKICINSFCSTYVISSGLRLWQIRQMRQMRKAIAKMKSEH